MTDALPLHLDESLLIGAGSHRKCYQHPSNPALCIKITINSSCTRRHQNPREYAYYQLLEKRGIDWRRIARCHGWVQTNLGRGLMFDHIRGPDGQTLPNLEEQLKQGILNHEMLRHELWQLREWLIRNAVIVCDLQLANMVLIPQRRPGEKLVLVDGVNNRNLIKIANYLPPLARSKMRRI